MISITQSIPGEYLLHRWQTITRCHLLNKFTFEEHQFYRASVDGLARLLALEIFICDKLTQCSLTGINMRQVFIPLGYNCTLTGCVGYLVRKNSHFVTVKFERDILHKGFSCSFITKLICGWSWV